MLHLAERIFFVFAATLSASLALLILSGVGAVFFGVFDKLCLLAVRLGDPLRRLVGKPRYETILDPGLDAIYVAVEDDGPQWSPLAKIGIFAALILFGVFVGQITANRRHYDYRPVEYVPTPPAASCAPKVLARDGAEPHQSAARRAAQSPPSPYFPLAASARD